MKYKSSNSKNGEFSPKIEKDVNSMVDIYCRIKDINKTKFVNDILRTKMIEIFKEKL